MAKSLITCDCLGTQTIDTEALSRTTGLDVRPPCSALCTTQIDRLEAAQKSGDVVICCQQETRIFDEVAEALKLPAPSTLDLRDRAGWSEDTASKLPKMSALIADGILPSSLEKTVDVMSEGLCLILGPTEAALDAADRLSDYLSVTVLLASAADIPETHDYDVVVGKLRHTSGAFGGFNVVLDQLQQTTSAGRAANNLTAPKDGAVSQCDIILDLTGGTPLFPAPEKREGYLRADPSHPPSVAAAIMAASHMIGTFEKTLYVQTAPLLCAHSRAEQSGCSNCLDLCPTGAISPNGDHVSIDPMICAGCGACSAACPSGAISYDAPSVDATIMRVQTMAKAYLDAGGTAPRLMVHDTHGSEMVRLSARHGRGLPADVIPIEMPAIGAFGHAEIVAALAAGFASVILLPGPGADVPVLEAQILLATHIAGEGKATLLSTPDPDAMSDALYAAATPEPVAQPVRPMGTRRQITRQAARALQPEQGTLPLPADAPYGAVLVDTAMCTLCLSCVSLCPSGALGDNEDKPQLRFQEDACLQCGLCANICPEDAISYEPRLNLTDEALRQTVLNEEEPFACIDCGALFGSKSAIERITEKLSGHSMFGGDKLKMIQMCDTCRVNAQFHATDNPFAAGERPRVRTTDDYLSKRRDH